MNYGKKSAAQKRNSLISRSSMMGKRARVSFIRLLFVSLIALCIGVTCLGIGSFKGVIDNAPDVDDIDIMPLGYATFLYDDQGNQIRKLAAPDANRLPVTLEQIHGSFRNICCNIAPAACIVHGKRNRDDHTNDN